MIHRVHSARTHTVCQFEKPLGIDKCQFNYPEKMQIEVRIAFEEPKIIAMSSAHFDQDVSLLANFLTLEFRTFLPVCGCAECPPNVLIVHQHGVIMQEDLFDADVQDMISLSVCHRCTFSNAFTPICWKCN